MRQLHPLLLVAAVMAATLALAGCTSPAPNPTATVTASSSTASSPAPTVTATTTVSPSAPATTAAAGCPADNGQLSSDATARTTADVDGDGRADRVFSAAAKGEFGLVTASGAHLTVMYDSSSPDTEVAWAARISGGAGLLVISDGTVATMWSIHHGNGACGLQTVRNAQGKPYEFLVRRERGLGTGSGLGCRSEGGRTVLGGYAVTPTTKTTARVTFTPVAVSADGSTATNGAKQVLATATPDDSAIVAGAEGSACLDAALVTLPS